MGHVASFEQSLQCLFRSTDCESVEHINLSVELSGPGLQFSSWHISVRSKKKILVWLRKSFINMCKPYFGLSAQLWYIQALQMLSRLLLLSSLIRVCSACNLIRLTVLQLGCPKKLFLCCISLIDSSLTMFRQVLQTLAFLLMYSLINLLANLLDYLNCILNYSKSLLKLIFALIGARLICQTLQIMTGQIGSAGFINLQDWSCLEKLSLQ